MLRALEPRAGAIAVLVVTLLASVCAAQNYTDYQERPDLPGVEAIDELIAAYNDPTPEHLARVMSDWFSGEFAEMPSEVHQSAFQSWRRTNGDLEYVAVRTYLPAQPERLVVILRSDLLDSYRAFVLPYAPDGTFESISLVPARPPSYLPPRDPMQFDQAVGALDDLITRLDDAGVFSGTIIVTKDGRRVLERACGEASIRYGVPNTMDTKFNIGSMNKMITAVAIAQLVERGKLSFTDTVGKHLPDYPNQRVRDEVRIEHLLTHTSGLGSHFNETFITSSKTMYRDIDDQIELFAQDELMFSPGEGESYSNGGFLVLGKIVESASGMSYYDYVREYIYKPAGMTNSDCYDMDIPVKNLASGYTSSPMGGMPEDGARWLEESNGLRENIFMHSIKGGPAGGGFSTTPDLIAFAEALRNGTLVSEEMYGTLTTAKRELGANSYGYGFSVFEAPNVGKVVGHSGGFPGINAELRIFEDQGVVIAVATNVNDGATLVSSRFREMLMSGY